MSVTAKFLAVECITPTDVTAFKGQRVMFNCSGSNVKWFKDTTKIFTSPDAWNTPKGTKYDIIGNYYLVIKDVDPSSDGGTYRCDTDEVSTHLVTANLVVLGNVFMQALFNYVL